jgi:hypothetical protein
LAVAQARCLILLREGYITFDEAFKKEAEFGVFSQVALLKKFEKVDSTQLYKCLRNGSPIKAFEDESKKQLYSALELKI